MRTTERLRRRCHECGKPLKECQRKCCSQVCGGKRVAKKYSKGKTNPMYGRTGERCPSWNNGRHVSRSGNTWIHKNRLTEEELKIVAPMFQGKDRYIRQSRLRMALHFGRALDRKETVHHINHDVTDDRIANLWLFRTRGKHTSYHFAVKRMAKKGLHLVVQIEDRIVTRWFIHREKLLAA